MVISVAGTVWLTSEETVQVRAGIRRGAFSCRFRHRAVAFGYRLVRGWLAAGMCEYRWGPTVRWAISV